MNSWIGELHRSWAGAWVPCPLQACHSPSTSTCALTWKISEPRTLGIYEDFITHAWLIINTIFSPFPFNRMGGGRAENPKLLIMAWSFWWPAPIQEYTQCWLIQTRDTQKLQGFLEPCVKNWGQRPTPEQEMLHVFLGNYMGLGSCVLGLGGRDQYIFFLLSQSSRASQVALVVKNSPEMQET